jgi:hypothetical protein
MTNVRKSQLSPTLASVPKIIERLKETVPVYVIALFSAVAVLIDGIAAINLLSAQIAILILIALAIYITWWYEKTQAKTTDWLQILVAIVNGALWLFVINMRFFNLGVIVEFWFRFGAAIWTFLWTTLFKFT